jgi:hypothetical protein
VVDCFGALAAKLNFRHASFAPQTALINFSSRCSPQRCTLICIIPFFICASICHQLSSSRFYLIRPLLTKTPSEIIDWSIQQVRPVAPLIQTKPTPKNHTLCLSPRPSLWASPHPLSGVTSVFRGGPVSDN